LKKTELKKIQSGSHDNLYFILDIQNFLKNVARETEILISNKVHLLYFLIYAKHDVIGMWD